MTISEKLKAWGELLRVPNLFTVPGDPLAGFCLASVAGSTAVSFSALPVWGVLLISLFSYCAGLVQNDYFDLEEDRRDRPSRPLPSYRVAPSTAIIVASLFAVAGLVTAFFVGVATGIIATVLVLVITIYNHSAKPVPIVGPILMGLCRGLSFLLGASVLGWRGISTPAIVVSAILLSLYIATVTYIAASETESYNSGAMRWGPGATILVWFLGLYFLIRPSTLYALPASITLALLSGFWTLYCGSLLVTHASPEVIQQTIGRFLRGLLLIQATVVALHGYSGFVIVLLLLAAWPISQKLGRRFYAS